MWQIKFIRLLVVIATLSTVSIENVLAQDGIDDRLWLPVQEAIDRTYGSESYYLSMQVSSSIYQLFENGEVSENHRLITREAERDKTGNSYAKNIIYDSFAVRDLFDPPIIQLDTIYFGDDVYRYLEVDGTLLETRYGVPTGWWQGDDLYDAFKDERVSDWVRRLLLLPVPSLGAITKEDIVNLIQLETEIVDNSEAHVFEMLLDWRKVIFGLEGDSNVSTDPYYVFPDGIDGNVSYQIWIEAETGNLHRTRNKMHLYNPEVMGTTDSGEILPTTYEQFVTIDVEYFGYGEPIEVVPPENLMTP